MTGNAEVIKTQLSVSLLPTIRSGPAIDTNGVAGGMVENADSENVYLCRDNRANWLLGGGMEIPAQLPCIGTGAFVIRDRDAKGSFTGDDVLSSIFVLDLRITR